MYVTQDERADSSSPMADLTSKVGIHHVSILTVDKLEDAALDLERRRITRTEEIKASKAMEALEVKQPEPVKSEDVELIVSDQKVGSGRCHLSAFAQELEMRLSAELVCCDRAGDLSRLGIELES